MFVLRLPPPSQAQSTLGGAGKAQEQHEQQERLQTQAHREVARLVAGLCFQGRTAVTPERLRPHSKRDWWAGQGTKLRKALGRSPADFYGMERAV